MSAAVYYNDSEPFVVAWLKNLMQAGLIPAGDVDGRPIQEVTPSDVNGYTQCHFFAGIGGWAYALQLAGWGDRPVWTGSCPCQPFSTAGARKSHADERHLWPAWCHLIRECHPDTIFGEQVSGAAGLGWLDAVALDLEAADYAVGACVLGAHSVGAPHLRQRLYFVADRNGTRCGAGRTGEAGDGRDTPWLEPSRLRITGELADTDGGKPSNGNLQCGGEHGQRPQDGGTRELADATSKQTRSPRLPRQPWNADFIPCRDGKARPVEPGTFPLAHGIPQRVGRLRAYGNAIVPQVAAAFVSAYLDLASFPSRSAPQ